MLQQIIIHLSIFSFLLLIDCPSAEIINAEIKQVPQVLCEYTVNWDSSFPVSFCSSSAELFASKQKSNKTRRAQTIENQWTTCNTRLNVEMANKLACSTEAGGEKWWTWSEEREMGGQCLKAIEKLLLYACRQQKFAYVNRNSSKNRPGKQFIYCRSTCKAQPEA